MDRKGIAIITACVLFVIIWQFYVGPNYFPARKPEDRQPKEVGGPAPTPESTPSFEQAKKEVPAKPQPVEPVQTVETPSAPPEEIILENELCEFTFTSIGGMLKRVRLKKFLDGEKKELALVEPFDGETLPLGLELLRPEMDLRGSNHSAEKDGDTARFALSLSNGLRVEKEMQITPGKYDFTLILKFSNTSDTPLNFTPKLHGPGSIVREDDVQNYLTGAAYYLKNRKPDSKTTKPGKKWQIPSDILVEKDPGSTSDISLKYIGVCNRFFGSAIIVKDPLLVRGLGTAPLESAAMLEKIAADPTSPTRKEKDLATSISSYIVMTPIELDPGTSSEFVFTFYTGPKQAEELAKYGPLSNLLDYGMFRAISKMMLVVLRFFYSVSGNYGIAIILMTVLVKAVLFPLSRKGALSQAKQQKLAPQIKELQAKYKNNKKKLHQETMKMYREEGVHPLGGCLPMLLQLPVFIGLLRLLQYSIEIRQAVFIPGWINDLSRPDTIGYFPAGLPLLGGLRINILPIIMGTVSILHQKMMPKPADPQAQQQMMMFKFMPLMFVFLLYNWASGLLLYWTISSSLSILEQYLIRKNIGKT